LFIIFLGAIEKNFPVCCLLTGIYSALRVCIVYVELVPIYCCIVLYCIIRLHGRLMSLCLTSQGLTVPRL